MQRIIRIFVLLVVICLLTVSNGSAGRIKDVVLPQWWELTGSMHDKRIDFTLSVLPDGKALAAGGTYVDGGTFYLNSSETYDFASGTWTLAGNMNAPRTRHTATVLLNEGVLVTGGTNGLGPVNSVEVYDPVTRTWSLTGAMSQAREGHTATRLADGRVLVVGGCQTISCLVSAEIYDPTARTWQTAASLTSGARKYHTAVLLTDGSVLVAGGYNPTGTSPTYYKSAYRYFPTSNIWSAAGGMLEYRSQHTAVLQRNGKVMVVGGYGIPPFGSPTWPNTTEAYDPATNSWAKLVNGSGDDIIIDYGKKQAMGILDALGSYFLFGGTDGTESDSVLYRSLLNDTDVWHSHGTLQHPRSGAAAVQLPNGAILLAGGKNGISLNGGGMANAEINTVRSGSTELTFGFGISGTAYSSGTLMPNGDILFTGGANAVHQSNSLPCHKTAHLWLKEEAIDSLAAQMHWERCNHSTTLLPDGRVVVIGGSVTTLGGSAAGAAEILKDGVWTSINGPSLPGPETALLPDGQILIIDPATKPHGYLFDPQNLSFRQTNGDYSGTYNGHTITLMNNGKVLILGSTSSDITEVYDPETETFSVVPSLSDRRLTHTATLLPNGKVLIAGGRYGSGPNQGVAIDNTYLFNPYALPSNPWTTLDTLNDARYFHSAVLLPDGLVAVLGGQQGLTATINSIEVYDPARNTWAVVGTMLADRSAHKTILSTKGKLVTFGGYGDGYTARTTVEQFELANISSSGFFWRPTVSSATCINCAGAWQVDVTGSGFTNPPEGSSGGTSQSAANTPLVQIMRLDNQQILWLNPGQASSDSHFRSAPIVGFPTGPVLVNVFSKGSVQGTVLQRNDQLSRIFIPLVKR